MFYPRRSTSTPKLNAGATRTAMCGCWMNPAAAIIFNSTPQADGLLLQDHQSRHGTWQGSKRVDETLLSDGMRFQAANANFMVVRAESHSSVVIGDGGISLGEVESREPRPWRGGDDLSELAGLHALTRRLAQTPTYGNGPNCSAGSVPRCLTANAARWCAPGRCCTAAARRAWPRAWVRIGGAAADPERSSRANHRRRGRAPPPVCPLQRYLFAGNPRFGARGPGARRPRAPGPPQRRSRPLFPRQPRRSPRRHHRRQRRHGAPAPAYAALAMSTRRS